MSDSRNCVDSVTISLQDVYRRRFFRGRFDGDVSLAAAIEKKVCSGPNRLSFFYLWGVGTKQCPDSWDERGMDFLESLLAHLGACFSIETDLCLVIADTHGELNGIPCEARLSYQNSIQEMAESRGWRNLLLSSIVGAPVANSELFTLEELYQLPFADRLLGSAKKHYYLGSPEEGACLYLSERRYEAPFLERYFKDEIMLSSSSWHLRDLQPQLPCFWVWSIKRGIGHKPWFIKETNLCAE